MLVRQIRNALVAAFVLSLGLSSLAQVAASRQPEQLEVAVKAYRLVGEIGR